MNASPIGIIELFAIRYEMHITFPVGSSRQLLRKFTTLILFKRQTPQVLLSCHSSTEDQRFAVRTNTFSRGIEFEISEETESMFNPFKFNLNRLIFFSGFLSFTSLLSPSCSFSDSSSFWRLNRLLLFRWTLLRAAAAYPAFPPEIVDQNLLP